MKTLQKVFAFVLLSAGLVSCGGDTGASSAGMFGNIPGQIENYENDRKTLESGTTEKNYKEISEKVNLLKEETTGKLEEEGQALNGKAISLEMNEEELKVEEAVTILYKSVFSNLKAVEFGIFGKVVAAKELPLEIDKKDLSRNADFYGKEKTLLKVKLPVHIQFLDKEGNVVDERTIGSLSAENDGETAVIKPGTPVEFSGSVPVGAKYAGVESARLAIDLSKGLVSMSAQ